MSEDVERFPPVEKLVNSKPSECGAGLDINCLIALEAASKAFQPKGDWGTNYELVKAAFDPLFYFSQNRDICEKQLDPIGHYLRAGARENRDPAPWFSTKEYRAAYLAGNEDPALKISNPFVHYLTQGRSAGYAPRAPANYDLFCASLGMSVVQTSDLVTRRVKDVRGRLHNGELGRMVGKAAALDPAIHASWAAGIRVRVPPASNEKSVARIGHLIDLQSQALQCRARAVVVVPGHDAGVSQGDIQQIIDRVIRDVGAENIVILYTSDQWADLRLLPSIRCVELLKAMPRMKNAQVDRTLVEFIRSLRPEVVVNLQASLMNRALRVLGRAVAAYSVVYQFLPFDVAHEQGRAQLGRLYYRAIDLHLRVIVATPQARDYLVETFLLSEQRRTEIWVARTDRLASAKTGTADA